MIKKLIFICCLAGGFFLFACSFRQEKIDISTVKNLKIEGDVYSIKLPYERVSWSVNIDGFELSPEDQAQTVELMIINKNLYPIAIVSPGMSTRTQIDSNQSVISWKGKLKELTEKGLGIPITPDKAAEDKSPTYIEIRLTGDGNSSLNGRLVITASITDAL